MKVWQVCIAALLLILVIYLTDFTFKDTFVARIQDGFVGSSGGTSTPNVFTVTFTPSANATSYSIQLYSNTTSATTGGNPRGSPQVLQASEAFPGGATTSIPVTFTDPSSMSSPYYYTKVTASGSGLTKDQTSASVEGEFVIGGSTLVEDNTCSGRTATISGPTTATKGATSSFTCILTPAYTGALTYFWTMDGQPITGVAPTTTPTVQIPMTTVGVRSIGCRAGVPCNVDATTKSITVTDPTPSCTSIATITADKTSPKASDTIKFTCNLTPPYTGALTYSWKRGTIDIPGTTNTISTTLPEGQHTIICTVSAPCSSTTSLPITVEPRQITNQEVNDSIVIKTNLPSKELNLLKTGPDVPARTRVIVSFKPPDCSTDYEVALHGPVIDGKMENAPDVSNGSRYTRVNRAFCDRGMITCIWRDIRNDISQQTNGLPDKCYVSIMNNKTNQYVVNYYNSQSGGLEPTAISKVLTPLVVDSYEFHY